MEFRKMVTITLFTRQQKRHWCIEQSFGLCGRGRGWNDLGEWHWNMYNIIYETSRQSRFDAWYWMLGAGALGWPRGMVWGGMREEGSGWGTHVYLWHNIVKLNKIKFKKRGGTAFIGWSGKASWRRWCSSCKWRVRASNMKAGGKGFRQMEDISKCLRPKKPQGCLRWKKTRVTEMRDQC